MSRPFVEVNSRALSPRGKLSNVLSRAQPTYTQTERFCFLSR